MGSTTTQPIHWFQQVLNHCLLRPSRQNLQRTTLALALAAALAAPTAQAADGIFDLGALNGGSYTQAMGVSADGSVVVGVAADGAVGEEERAFRWTQGGGMLSLGVLNGGNYSQALGVSADGSVVVGQAADGAAGGQARAFRWTQGGGMLSLGVLNGGNYSQALGVSADGSVVVGGAADGAAGNRGRAFRWTQGGGMLSLGVLNGGIFSQAVGVSADGSVVVGQAADGAAGNQLRAFRWTQGGGMLSLGVLNGGNQSLARSASADGSVVVGRAIDGAAGNQQRAFRWTQGGGMLSLGVLNGGSYSDALGVSADGSVVVGYGTDAGAAGGGFRAFRWTQGGGMQSVEQWLAANGVTVAPGLATGFAAATNADGSVVVGVLESGFAYLARVAPAGSSGGSGLIDIADYNRTLQGAAYVPVQALAESDLILHGMHGSPLRGVPKAGQRNVWVGGDWGRQENVGRDGDIGAGEVGIAYGLSDSLALKAAVGRTYSQQHLLYNGGATLRGTYLVPELIAALPGTPLRVSASGYYNIGEADIKRGYLNAGTEVKSSGTPDTRNAGLRLRADWQNLLEGGGFTLTPYASLTRYRTRIDGYTETGGGFPVRWDKRVDDSTLARVGADATYALNGEWTLLGRLEGVHRLDQRSKGATGTILGLGSFAFEGLDYKRDWVRAAVGAEGRVGPGIASLMVNASTETNGATYWGQASYRIEF